MEKQTQLQPGQPTANKPSRRELLPVVRASFEHLRDAYGEAFAPLARRKDESEKQYQARARKNLDLWAAALSDLTPVEIHQGTVRCIREMPYGTRITPADIISRSKIDPEELGLLDEATAFDVASCQVYKQEDQQKWPNVVVQLAAFQVGYSTWRNASTVKCRARFYQKYQAAVTRHANGETLQIPKAKELPPAPENDAPPPGTWQAVLHEAMLAGAESLKGKSLDEMLEAIRKKARGR